MTDLSDARARLEELKDAPHYIRFDDDGWYIRHPMTCDGVCEFTTWAREYAGKPRGLLPQWGRMVYDE
ncbi:MAG TPA: hypothetical protein VGA66_10310, partial [Mycobacterium sp.]